MKDRFVPGAHNVICDRTGFKIKSTKAKKEWTGNIVRKSSWEARHPQDFVRSKPERINIVGARPVPAIVYQGYGDPDSALSNAADILSSVISTTTNATLFSADTDTVTIGNVNKFYGIRFDLATAASTTITPTFEYSTGVGTWATFSANDNTVGMTISGLIHWSEYEIPGWAVGTGSEYLIRITRTAATLATPPVESLVQIFSPAEFDTQASSL